MNEKNFPWQGCGTNTDITGCRFYVCPMSDHFVPMIMGAINKVNTENIWSTTDQTSTVYRGQKEHVVDCLKACLVHIYDPSVHIVLEATFSKGCPGDSNDSDPLPTNDSLLNNTLKQFPVLCKFSFYPLGTANYMDQIAHIVHLAIERKLYTGSAFYVSFLEGDVNDIFSYVSEVLAYAEQNSSHYVFEMTLSLNSPTGKRK